MNAEVCADTIDREVVGVAALAIHTELARSVILSGGEHYARRHRDQGLKAASIKRHVVHELLVDHCTDGCRLGLKQGNAVLDGYGLRPGAECEHEVFVGGVLGVEFKVGLDDGAEAILFDGQPVVGWVEAGKDVDPVFVGCSRGRDVGVDVGDRAFGPGDHCAAYVRHSA